MGHETGHWAGEATDESIFKKILGLPDYVDIHDPMALKLTPNLEDTLSRNLMADVEDVGKLAKQYGLPNPLLADPNRWYYWKVGSWPQRADYSLGGELIADFHGLSALGYPPEKLMPNTIKWRDPLMGNLNLKEIEEIRKKWQTP
jgi:hypothetical protein